MRAALAEARRCHSSIRRHRSDRDVTHEAGSVRISRRRQRRGGGRRCWPRPAARPRSWRAGRASCRCSISACCGPRSWSTSTAFPGSRSSRRTSDAITIGALTRHHQLETSPVIAAHLPVLADAMTHVAHLAIRNRGTIGGSLSHADPGRRAADDGAAARCRDCASLGAGHAHGRGARFLPRCAHRRRSPSDEIVTEVALPKLPPNTGWGFEEVARRSGDFALAAVGRDADAVAMERSRRRASPLTGVGRRARCARARQRRC